VPEFYLPPLSSDLKHKIALGIEYNGYRYYGWQRQEHVPGIQSCLEHALSKIANESITVCCAGRTDAGVHATAQVVHFLTKAVRKEVSWIMGVNTYLPPDITVRWAKKVEKDFHARFSATARRYRYLIFNDRQSACSLFQRDSRITVCHSMKIRWNVPHNAYWEKMILVHFEPLNVNQKHLGVMCIISR